MRLITRKERPYPGAQLRFTDVDRMRLACFATTTANAPTAQLDLRHCQRDRVEDRIRTARDIGLRNLPLHRAAQNRTWLVNVQIALDLLARMLTGEARRWNPSGSGYGCSSAGQLATTGRCHYLRLAQHWPSTHLITTAFDRLQALPKPG